MSVLVLLPLAAGAAPGWAAPAPAAPPPPRFVPIHSAAHVVAVWSEPGTGPAGPVLPAEEAPAGDATLLSQTASPGSVGPGGLLQYTVTVTNATPLTQSFHITDTLPAALAYVTGTATGGFVYDAGSASLTATTRTLNAFQGEVVAASGAPTYTELASPSNPSICQLYFPQCDDNAITLSGIAFQYLGVPYTALTLDSNGFVIPGSVNPGLGNLNQDLPNPAAPNGVIAPFWTDLDLDGSSPSDTGGGDWYYAVEHDQGSGFDYLVVEWSQAQLKGNGSTHDSFEVWIQLNAEHITFAYQSLIGATSPATIGFENSDGTLGATYLYNGAGSVPAAGTELQINAAYDTTQLGYEVQAQSGLPGCSTIANTATLSGDLSQQTASATALTAVFGPCVYLPAIRR